jgi:hypothetical protein
MTHRYSATSVSRNSPPTRLMPTAALPSLPFVRLASNEACAYRCSATTIHCSAAISHSRDSPSRRPVTRYSSATTCYNTVRTPTLCKPDTSDRPYYFPFNLLNLATPLTTYAVRLVLLILVLLSSLPCYLYDAILILTSDILYSLINTFLSILRYINTHVFIVEP